LRRGFKTYRLLLIGADCGVFFWAALRLGNAEIAPLHTLTYVSRVIIFALPLSLISFCSHSYTGRHTSRCLLLLRIVFISASIYWAGSDAAVKDGLLAAAILDTCVTRPWLTAIGVLAGIQASIFAWAGLAQLFQEQVSGNSPAWLSLGPASMLALGCGWLIAVHQRSETNLQALAEAHHQASGRLAEANVYLHDYAAQSERLATMQERYRVAREIHDVLGHILTSVVLRVDACRQIVAKDPERGLDDLDWIRNTSWEALQEVRRVVAAMRAKQDGELRGRELWSKAIEVFGATCGAKMEIFIDENFLDLEDELDSTVYRVIQEGLTNAYRHGRAGHITVAVGRDQEFLLVRICDNGLGASMITEGYGLKGMRERVGALGGELFYRTSPGVGFDLGVQIPMVSVGRHDD